MKKLETTPKKVDIVRDWVEFGHHFQIEKLNPPVIRGAYERFYRLYDNGHPALGGQWHYELEDAIARADYILRCDYVGRIQWLEMRVNTLQKENHELRRKIDEQAAV